MTDSRPPRLPPSIRTTVNRMAHQRAIDHEVRERLRLADIARALLKSGKSATEVETALRGI